MDYEENVKINLINYKFLNDCENENQTAIAVQLKEVAFSYGSASRGWFFRKSKPVKATLNECNINVPLGQIYALLGPSGCGKTTLIRSILGRIRPKSGIIRVFGNESQKCSKMMGKLNIFNLNSCINMCKYM